MTTYWLGWGGVLLVLGMCAASRKYRTLAWLGITRFLRKKKTPVRYIKDEEPFEESDEEEGPPKRD